MSLEFDKIMEPGDPLDLDVLTKDNTVIKLKSNIQLIKDNMEFFVSAPIYQGRIYPLESGSMVLVTLTRDTSGIYTFYATVGGRTDFEKVSVIQLKKSSEVKKSQRRKYFRLPFIGEIEVKDPNQKEETEAEKKKREALKEKFKDNPDIIIDDEPEIDYLEMTGKDLSGGGFRALSKHKIETGQKIEGTIYLDQLVLEFKGKVVRCKSTLDTYENYEIGVMFEGMDDQVRSQIISYIFKKQRSMRKKGLI